MKLTNPTDNELNAAFAEHVAKMICWEEARGGYKLAVLQQGDKEPFAHWDAKEVARRKHLYRRISCIEAEQMGFFGSKWPDWTDSADAVLPWLEKFTTDTNKKYGGEGTGWQILAPVEDGGRWLVTPLWLHHDGAVEENPSYAPTFAKAAVIALLRAHGVEVEFT